MDFSNATLVFGDFLVSALLDKRWASRAQVLEVMSENMALIQQVLKGHRKVHGNILASLTYAFD